MSALALSVSENLYQARSNFRLSRECEGLDSKVEYLAG